MKNYNLTSETNTRLSFTSVFRFALIGMVSLFLSLNANSQAHADMQMVFVGSTATTADFDVVLTNDGTTTLNFHDMVMRANNNAPGTIATAGSVITVIALNNNPIPAWTVSGLTWPGMTGNLIYNQTYPSFKLNQGTFLNPSGGQFFGASKPSLPYNSPVNVGRFRFVVTGGTWIPNAQLGFVWSSTAGITCTVDGGASLVTFQGSNITLTQSANQPLNVPAGPVLTSQLQANLCGTTFNSMTQSLVATTASGATAYKFRVSGGGLGSPLTFTSTNSWTSLSNFALNFNTTYSVDVAPISGATQHPFGTACNITTPVAPTSHLQANLCGTTMSSIYQSIVATNVSGATAYTFRISGGALGTPLTYTSSTNWTSLFNFALGSSTTYTVDVAPTVGGITLPYGATCNITTVASPTSNLQANLCGTTLTSNYQSLVATTVSGATAYTFRINGGGLPTAQTFTSPNSWTSIANFSLVPGTTYSVTVAPTVGGTQHPYGSACNVTTVIAPITNLQASLCGTTMSSMFQSLVATTAAGATAYTFRISGGSLPLPLTFTSPNSWTSLSNFILNFNTTYTVDVAPTIGGTQYGFGSTCTIITPLAPTTTLQANLCGTVFDSLNQSLVATVVSGASSYTFRVSGGDLPSPVTHTATNSWTSLGLNFPVNYGITYNVQIAPTINGTLQAYGATCTITTPSLPAAISLNDKQPIEYNDKSLNQGSFTFETVVYPNPFTDVFHVELTSDDFKTPISLNVHDATGRMIESRTMNLNNESTIELGLDYAPGVYQVHVVQNENVKTSRIVKK